jgi:hypothetical protein
MRYPTERGLASMSRDTSSRSPSADARKMSGAAPGREESAPRPARRESPLRGCGLVVFVTCVDARATLEQQTCGRHVAGEMQRGARVAAFRVDERRIGVEHARQVIGEAKPRGRVNGQRGAPVNQRSRHSRIDLAGMETRRPPVADGLEIFRRP